MRAVDIIEQIDSIINEGVYDPSIFKAIFAAGGSGSGKSYVTGMATGGLGYKVINSDDLFEFLMKKSKISLKLSDVSQDVYDPIRKKAKKITGKKEDILLNGRLGVIIDGTASNLRKVEDEKEKLEKLGYDTYMVFVNTSLDVALKRNQERPRSLPDDKVKEKWEEVQKNMNDLRELFDSNFLLINNNDFMDKDTEIIKELWHKIMMLSKNKPKNPKAIEWIKRELVAKKNRKKIG